MKEGAGIPMSDMFWCYVLLFFVSSFLGWVMEVTVKAIQFRRFINRGFLIGPYCPIYGVGTVLLTALLSPIKDEPVNVFIQAMVVCGVLEYVTSWLMEKLFHARWWDYSHKRFNFQGHICLTSSLAWGVMSVLLVYYLNQPVEKLIGMIDPQIRQIIVFVITVIFTVDLTHAVTTAIDLKKLLARVDTMREEVRKLQKRIENLETAAKEAKDQRLAQLTDELNALRDKQRMMGDMLAERFDTAKRSLLRRNPTALSKKYKEALDKIHEWQARRS